FIRRQRQMCISDSLYGNPGGYHSTLSQKTWKEPCPRCLGPITRQAYLGGNVYFCPHCQI
ncbi:hypothetical protein F1904_12275, partial [Akkermansia muciniphila]